MLQIQQSRSGNCNKNECRSMLQAMQQRDKVEVNAQSIQDKVTENLAMLQTRKLKPILHREARSERSWRGASRFQIVRMVGVAKFWGRCVVMACLKSARHSQWTSGFPNPSLQVSCHSSTGGAVGSSFALLEAYALCSEARIHFHKPREPCQIPRIPHLEG